MNIKQIVQEALTKAAGLPDSGGSLQFIHRNRSRQFVEIIASLLRDAYKDRESVYVLSKHYDQFRLEFGLNELLYDILVCETSKIHSSREHANLTIITGAIWQIESEFARDTREAIYDFNKLIVGSGEYKLFIGPKVSDETTFLQSLADAAKHCCGQTHLALVPHPAVWQSEQLEIQYWKYNNGWQLI